MPNSWSLNEGANQWSASREAGTFLSFSLPPTPYLSHLHGLKESSLSSFKIKYLGKTWQYNHK
jgi:hypothetical protein